MDLSFYEFVGDGIGNDDIVLEVSKRLEEKYKMKFIAKRIGDRFGKDEDDIVKIYFHPEGMEKFIFSAKYNIETKEYFDDFCYRKVCYEIEENLSTILKNMNIDSSIRVEMINKNSLNEIIQLGDFINKYPQITFLAYVIVKENQDELKIQEAFNQLMVPNINSFVFYATQEEYDIIENNLLDLEVYTKSMLTRYIKKDPNIFNKKNGNVAKIR